MEVEINGTRYSISKPMRNVRLVDYLRDELGLTGTKFGCGAGLCGACTIHIDGAAVRSCLMSVEDAAGSSVLTIEGLASSSKSEDLHPVQRAWIEKDVPQCGYCQAGQIMTAAALLEENPSPTQQEIKDGMAGNLCRCGTYSRIRDAVHMASKEISK